MKRFDAFDQPRRYTDTIRWRIRLLWVLLAGMLVYMVVVAELGGGDSRKMTGLAAVTSRLLFFGGLVYVGACIHHNKKLLRDRALLAEQQLRELDERNRYLHDKSGGIVVDLLLFVLLVTTTTAALFNTAAFYTAFAILLCTLALKFGSYWVYSRRGGD